MINMHRSIGDNFPHNGDGGLLLLGGVCLLGTPFFVLLYGLFDIDKTVLTRCLPNGYCSPSSMSF